MRLEEKLWMIHGDNVYDTKGVERLHMFEESRQPGAYL